MGQELRRCCSGEQHLPEQGEPTRKPAALQLDLDNVVLDELLPCPATDDLLSVHTPPSCRVSRNIRVPAAALSRDYDHDNVGNSPPKARRPPKRSDSWHDELPGLPCEDGSVAKITPTRAKPSLFSPYGGIATPLRLRPIPQSPTFHKDDAMIRDFPPWTPSMEEAVLREQQLAVAGGVPSVLRHLLMQPVGEELDGLVAENSFAWDISFLSAAFQYLKEGSATALAPGHSNVEDFLLKFTCLKSTCALRAEISSWAPGPMSSETFMSFVRSHAVPCHVVESLAGSVPEDSESGRTSRRRLMACLAASVQPLLGTQSTDMARRAATVVARSLSCDRALSRMEFEAAHRRTAASARVLAILASGDANLWLNKSGAKP